MDAGAYCAVVLEYLAAEVLEVSGQVVRRTDGRLRMFKRDMDSAIANDAELSALMERVLPPSLSYSGGPGVRIAISTLPHRKAGGDEDRAALYQRFEKYSYTVLKQVHDEIGTSRCGRDYLNIFVNEVLLHLGETALAIMEKRGGSVLSLEDVQGATACLPEGELK